MAQHLTLLPFNTIYMKIYFIKLRIQLKDVNVLSLIVSLMNINTTHLQEENPFHSCIT